ncbi:MAG: hypothetical protein ACQEQV_04540 [Fibrobacterota bacterium]
MTAPDAEIRTAAAGATQVYVYPDIDKSSRYNPYLRLLWQDSALSVQSARPLMPAYLLHPHRAVVHYNWLAVSTPADIIKTAVKMLSLIPFRFLGGRIIWTVHNTQPHEQKYPRLNRILRAWFARFCTALFVHSLQARRFAQKEYHLPRQKIYIIDHPTYPVHPIEQNEAETAFRRLLPQVKPGQHRILIYGNIARYKNIAEAAACAAHYPQIALIIAGRVKEKDAYEEIKDGAAPNIHIINRFITPREEQVLFSACHGALFNFTDMLTSGSLTLAQNYGIPIWLRRNPHLRAPRTANTHCFRDAEELMQLMARHE